MFKPCFAEYIVLWETPILTFQIFSVWTLWVLPACIPLLFRTCSKFELKVVEPNPNLIAEVFGLDLILISICVEYTNEEGLVAR